MKILKDAGTFTVLTKPENVISDIANAARTCYQSQDKASPENDFKLVKNLMARGHEAMLEFADMTVRFDLVSRGQTHEQVRMRISSFAQESSRYVDESDFLIVVPPHKDEYSDSIELTMPDGEIQIMSLAQWFELNEQAYRSLRKNGWKPEDARQTLPTAIKSQIVHKANIREWRHIFTMRCDKFAHWEIRAVMLKLLKWCQENIPVVFDDFHFYNENGIEYARPVMSTFNLVEKINDYIKTGFDFSEVLNKLPKDVISKYIKETENENN